MKQTGATVRCKAGCLPKCLQEDLTLFPLTKASLFIQRFVIYLLPNWNRHSKVGDCHLLPVNYCHVTWKRKLCENEFNCLKTVLKNSVDNAL